mgnify:FL=1
MSRQEFESQDNPSPEITPEIILAITPELIAANMQKARVLRSRTFLNGLRAAFKAFSEWKLSNFAAHRMAIMPEYLRDNMRVAVASASFVFGGALNDNAQAGRAINNKHAA